MHGRLLALAIVVALGAGVGNAAAATITVSTTQDELASGDGLCSLREAIAIADAPGTSNDCGTSSATANRVVLGPHTYALSIAPTGPDDVTTGDLNLTSQVGDLTVIGAGRQLTKVNAAGLSDRLFDVTTGASATLEDLTLTGGHAPDGADGGSDPMTGQGFPGGDGANGGAIENSGQLTLSDVVVSANRAGGGGTGAHGFQFFPAAVGGNGGAGGGIYNDTDGHLTLLSTTVTGNHAGDGGKGGFGASGGSSAGAGGSGGCCGDGGGIANGGGQLIVRASTITQNIAGNGGDGGDGGQTEPNSVAAGGPGAGGASGGGISSVGGTVTIVNSTISSNLSGRGGNGGNGGFAGTPGTVGKGGDAGNGSVGGAIFARMGATVSLANVTVAGNHVSGPGTPGRGDPDGAVGQPASTGGIYANGATMSLKDTLLASNGLGNCGPVTPPTDEGHNLSFGDTTCPAGFLAGNPRLGVLRDNGGLTPTMRLGHQSAAVDKGADCPSIDQRGVHRPSGSACDIGAFEVAMPTVIVNPARRITQTAARLSGRVTANQATASVRFEYGTTIHYGTKSSVQHVTGLTPIAVLAKLGKLKPGTRYHYALIATSVDGSTTSADQTFTTRAPPRITKLRLTPSSFSPGRGTTISFRDSAAGTIRFLVRRCVRLASGARCTRLRNVGTFSHPARKGEDSLHWDGKLGGAPLRPGRYLLVVRPRAGGAFGATASAGFRVTRSSR